VPFGQTNALGEWRTYENLSLLNLSQINGTVGRLREFALALRDRLAELGYRDLPTLLTGDDSTELNVGDLKALFNFDLDSDTDLDGKTFAEEIAAGTNPYDWYDGQEHELVTVEGLDQSGPDDHFMEYPWTVRVIGPNGRIWVNAPVVFTAPTEGRGYLSAKGDGSTPLVKTLTAFTDGLGYAEVYMMIVSPEP
jgi:hypothetical protein